VIGITAAIAIGGAGDGVIVNKWHRANGGLNCTRPAGGYLLYDAGARANPFYEFMRPHSLSSKELAKQKSE